LTEKTKISISFCLRPNPGGAHLETIARVDCPVSLYRWCEFYFGGQAGDDYCCSKYIRAAIFVSFQTRDHAFRF
jgi:hypothetical protein